MDKKKLYITSVLVIAIIILANLISDELFFRWDFTDNKQYTLSDATKNLLKNLDKTITIKAYFSKDLPPKVGGVRRDFKDLLVEYANYSHGKIKYEFIDPNKNEKLENEAIQEGIKPVLVNVREKDQMKQQKAYLGAVIMYEEKKEVIPFVQPGAPLEYLLSSSIKKLTIKKKPIIGLVQGQGEATLNEMSQVINELKILYEVRYVNFNDTTTSVSLSNYKALLLVDPVDSFSDKELQLLTNYWNNGGRLLIAYNRLNSNLQQMYVQPINTGLETWLKDRGVDMPAKSVVDASCGMVTVQQERGMFRFMSNVAFPYFPIVKKFSDHPVVAGLEQVIFPFVSPVSYVGDTASVKATPLLYSSEKSNTVAAPFFINIQKQWTEVDFPEKNIVLAMALKNKKNGAKMVVFGDADFAINGKGQDKVQLGEDNINLFVNAVDWLADDTGLIGLRTKAVTSRPIKDLEDSTKTLLKYLNFLLPILLLILYGIIRYQRNKIIRIKRMGEYYK